MHWRVSASPVSDETVTYTVNGITAHEQLHAYEPLNFTRELYNMLVLARVITLGALARNESRGAHYKPEFPERDDNHWLRTTRAIWENGGVCFQYDPVDTSLIPPRARRYDVAK